MAFISYAQNLEDVMLFRALKKIEKGYYIDVGANDPSIHSVTKAFYDRGWNGINVEPVHSWFTRLENERPNDINLQIAVGDTKKYLDFYEVIDTGLSTLNKDIAEDHARSHGFKVSEYKVPSQSLNDICKQYPFPEIHFLKVDVEGAEMQVLKGLDLTVIRPWIIVVESTMPMTQNENYKDWEALLLNHNYQFVYFDGLNRFYTAREHADLNFSFRYPPVTFWDNFETSEHADLQQNYQILKTEKSILSKRLETAENHLAILHQSTSWRLTAPLRKVLDLLRSF